jgi:aminoglycoside phosphotransferase (APT) family kinase protein
VVPVAEVVAADESGPEPVLLSRFVPGRPVSEILDPSDATELARSVGAALAGIGSVSFDSPGFFTDGSLVPGPPGAEPISGLDSYVDRCLEKGNAAGHLTDAEQGALRQAAAEATPELAGLAGSRRLVHGDYNPKNLLAVRREGRWEVAAVLDWEYAFSSSPLFDIGNMLRDPRPAGFEEAFLAGYLDNGGDLPENWRRLSQALDLYSLADFLTRPVDHRYFRKSVARIRAMLAG